MISKFQKGSSTYTCKSCGKLTREISVGDRYRKVCRACNDLAEAENQHSDEDHSVSNPDSNCLICQQEGWVK